MNQNPTFYEHRQFLNEGSGLAAIEARISGSEYGTDTKRTRSVDGGISISDCSRRIELDFDVYDNQAMEERLAKIDSLIKTFREFRAAFVKAAKWRGEKA